jgi:diadenylate cyclase
MAPPWPDLVPGAPPAMERLRHLYESIGPRDLVEIGILALLMYGVLVFIGSIRGTGTVRGVAIVIAGFFLFAQLVILSFDFTELSQTLDYFLLAVLAALIVILQPEFRRGLLALGQHPLVRVLGRHPEALAEKLARAARLLAEDGTGALIVIQRGDSLAGFVKSGEPLDCLVSVSLLRALFQKTSPLHDGAVIICAGRIAAAGCQLPLAEAPEGAWLHGMRHRAALGISEETDAEVLVVSEETGTISLARSGRLTPVTPEDLLARLTTRLSRKEAVEVEGVEVVEAVEEE